MKKNPVFLIVLLGFVAIMQLCVPAHAQVMQELKYDAAENLTFCRRLDGYPHAQRVKIERTFFEMFSADKPMDSRWQTHFLGSDKWPEAQYWGGKNSNLKRTLVGNGEQQIYVDPQFRGLAEQPLGLNPFSLGKDSLTIEARRVPQHLSEALFGQPYMSGLLTTAGWFEQKYGFFEIQAKVPFGQAVWPAFWLLPNDTSWPPEIDVFEGRGQSLGTLALTAHWIDPDTNKHGVCSTNYYVRDADTALHLYGVLWQEDTLTYYVDRMPVFQVPTPPGYDKPMYMLVNLAIGANANTMQGVGRVNGKTPDPVRMEIKRITAYRLTSEGN